MSVDYLPAALAAASPGRRVAIKEHRRFADEWRTASLGALAEIRNGGTPSTRVPDYWDGDVPWCTPTDITGTRARHLVATARSITKKGLGSCGASLLPAGALLLCSRATIGELKIAAIPVATNQGFKSLVCGELVDHEYLYYRLLPLKEQMAGLATGSTFLEISKGDVSNIRLRLPSLPEQRAIAAVMSDVDGLIGSLEALVAKKRAIKRAAMQQLLTGRTRLPGFEGEWEMMRAGDVGRFGSGSGFPLRHQGQPQGRYPFFKVSDMNRDGNDVFLTRSGNYVTENTKRSLGAVAFPPEAIVFAKVGAAVFLDRKRILAQPSCLDNNMAAYVPDAERVDHLFVYYLLSSIRLSAFASTTALPSLSRTSLTGIRLHLPPHPEQRAIAAVLSDMDDEIAALERRLAKTRAIKQGMMQQLLTGAVRLPIPDDELGGASHDA